MSTDASRPELPDRLSTDYKSPHHHPAVFEHAIGVRFNDKERTDVEEYSMSEGWVRVALGKKVDRKGQPLTIKLSGPVEAWYQSGDAGEDAPAEAEAAADDDAA